LACAVLGSGAGDVTARDPIGGRRLGFAVKVLGHGGLPSHDTRRWQSQPHLRISLERFERILDRLERERISMYRMASSFVPYATHPGLPQFRGQLEQCAGDLERIGARVRRLDVRLSTHPGQYVVLNSAREDVHEAALRDVELQATLLDALGLGDEAVVVLHVGSAEGGTRQGLDRFLEAVGRLSDGARSRLVIENDDRTYALADVLDVSERTGLRVVWDILHHHCHDPLGIPDREALELALGTWHGRGTPKIHFSSPKTAVEERRVRKGRRVERSLVLPQLRAHADMIDPIAFEAFLRDVAGGLAFDVMLEAKAKDLALIRLREQLAARGLPVVDGRIGDPGGVEPDGTGGSRGDRTGQREGHD
jgi:UV DNA damage endonuclease